MELLIDLFGLTTRSNLICCGLKTICILICSVYVFALFQLTIPNSDTCQELGRHQSTACVDIEGAIGCKEHTYKEGILLEPCKQGCIAWAGTGTCVLAVHDKDVGSERGSCMFILKMDTPDVNLNVCSVIIPGTTTARCTVGG